MFIKICVLIISTIFLLSSRSFAQEQVIIDSLFGHAKTIEQKGRVLESINDYCRALMINSNHAQARSKLLELSIHPSLTATNKANLISINDLLIYNDSLLKRQEYFTLKISDFKAYLIKLGVNKNQVEEELAKDIIENKALEFNKASNGSIANLVLKLTEDRNNLLENISVLQKKMSNLKAFAKLNSSVKVVKRTTPLSNNISKASSFSSSYNLQLFKNEINQLKEHMAVLEKTNEEKDHKLLTLSNQVVNLSLELSQNEMLLNKRMAGLNKVDEGISDLKARFDLGQKIIKDKDSQINQIQEKLMKLQQQVQKQKEDFDKMLALKDEKLNEISGILDIYQGKLYEASTLVKKQGATISTLEEQINLIQYKALNRDISFNKSRKMTPALQKELTDMESSLKYQPQGQTAPQLEVLRQQVLLLKN